MLVVAAGLVDKTFDAFGYFNKGNMLCSIMDSCCFVIVVLFFAVCLLFVHDVSNARWGQDKEGDQDGVCISIFGGFFCTKRP